MTTPAAPGKTYNGKVAFIDPNIKEMTRSARVRVEIPNPMVDEHGRKRRELFHKLYAQGVVKVQLPEVLTVPRGAVLSPGQRAVVYVDREGGAYEQRRVTLGRAGDEFWEVLDGLNEGERVVTTGNFLIDAQAQLNQSGNPVAVTPETTGTTNTLPALNAAQRQGAAEFLSLVDAVTKALSDDKLEEFNRQAAKLHAAMPRVNGRAAGGAAVASVAAEN